jgi:hypothetical protein
LENNPIVIFLSRFFGALYNGRITLPNNWGEWSAILYSLGVAALGLTPDEFEKETLWQKINPFRIIIRLFYEPLRILLFSIHLFCEGEMFDRIEGVPIFLSVLSAMVLNLAQDLDYFFGHSHIDSTNTSAILNNHLADASNHDHHNNLPELILRFPFKPIFWLAYLWSSWGVPEEDTTSKDAHWDKIEGFKPRNKEALNQVANYRKTEDHQLFLFKAAQDKYPTSLNNDPCCVPNTFLLSKKAATLS